MNTIKALAAISLTYIISSILQTEILLLSTNVSFSSCPCISTLCNTFLA